MFKVPVVAAWSHQSKSGSSRQTVVSQSQLTCQPGHLPIAVEIIDPRRNRCKKG